MKTSCSLQFLTILPGVFVDLIHFYSRRNFPFACFIFYFAARYHKLLISVVSYTKVASCFFCRFQLSQFYLIWAFYNFRDSFCLYFIAFVKLEEIILSLNSVAVLKVELVIANLLTCLSNFIISKDGWFKLVAKLMREVMLSRCQDVLNFRTV